MGILLLPIFDCFQKTDVVVINSISEEWSYLNNSLKFVKSYEEKQTPISGMFSLKWDGLWSFYPACGSTQN